MSSLSIIYTYVGMVDKAKSVNLERLYQTTPSPALKMCCTKYVHSVHLKYNRNTYINILKAQLEFVFTNSIPR